jgi:hypothetical protein
MKIKLSEIVKKLLREYEGEDDPKHFSHDDDFPMEKGGDDRPEKKPEPAKAPTPEKKPETPGTPENGASHDSEAAEQAHKLKLIAKPYGNWADQSGKVVAKTVDGKLVKIADDEPAKDSQPGTASKQHASLDHGYAINNPSRYSYDRGATGKLSDELKKVVEQNAYKISRLDKLFTQEGGASNALKKLSPEVQSRMGGAIRTMAKVARHDYESAEKVGNQVNPEAGNTPGYAAMDGVIELYDKIKAGDIWDNDVEPHAGRIPSSPDAYEIDFDTSPDTDAVAYDLYRASAGLVRQGQDPFNDPKNKERYDQFVKSVKQDVRRSNPNAPQ